MMAGRVVPIAAFAIVIIIILIGCFGPWFDKQPTPVLYLGEPVVQGGQGHLVISVADMPDGGLAAIHVGLGGLLYDEEKVAAIVIEGLNGFAVAVSQFADGEGGFILWNLFGVETGPILRLTFDACANVKWGDIQLLADHITLCSDALGCIENWKTPAYYTK